MSDEVRELVDARWGEYGIDLGGAERNGSGPARKTGLRRVFGSR
jgi:hypothetical protein